jgi:SAM-dependent methyltransferase
MSNYHNQPQQQIDFLIKALDIKSTSRGLDIGCDYGYHTQELQKISPTIYGLDITEPKVLFPNFIQADLFKDSITVDKLDFVFCLTPYFGKDWWNIETLFEKINKSLVDNGLFVLDLINFNSYKVGFEYEDNFERFNKKIHTDYKREKDRLVGNRVFTLENGDVINKNIIWRVFTETELKDIAQKFGFAIKQTYDGFVTQNTGVWEPDGKAKRLIVLFEKQRSLKTSDDHNFRNDKI